jgi:hypothetical protein
MLILVRTTLIIDDYVLKEAKRQAIQSGMTLSELTTMALRETLRQRYRSPSARSIFTMPTYGSSAKQSSSPEEIAELRDEGR